MEVLSIGEKIKRTRIYKGFTLKNLCGKDLSVSKLSCIENGKIKAEDWIVKNLAQKLETDYDYLRKEIDEQIKENVNILKESSNKSQYADQLFEYIEIAEKNKYYELAFDLIHELFNFLLEKDKLTDIINLLGRYYEITRHTKSRDRLVYYYDAANYFSKNDEFIQALNYFKGIKDSLKTEYPDDLNMLYDVSFSEARCLCKIQEFEEVYSSAFELVKIAEKLKDNIKLGEAYRLLSVASINKNPKKSKEYFDTALEFYGDSNYYSASLYQDYSLQLFNNDLTEEAIVYMKKGIELFPKDLLSNYTQYLINFIEVLLNKKIQFDIENYINEALNNAISVDNIKLVERAYYYKTKILISKGDFLSAEMNMHLSFDSLKRFGNIKEIYDRYLEMANVYHDMGNTQDSIKYFALALKLKDNI